MAPPASEEDHKLVSELMTLSKNNKKLVHSSTYAAPADPSITVRSWKMNEWKYYDVPSPFPTLARGLFTTWHSDKAESKEGDGHGNYRIVARGYDKFFNIGEVPWTSWDALGRHTTPPYVMTLKSNGCIIFISALSNTKLLVTSKHSLGPVQGVPESHAEVGEKWLLMQLEAKGKKVEDLAQVLWDNNWTAVAELCDDSFEEHVLPYPPEKTGLHLHGINESRGAFKTLTSDKVAAFAREWGLIETPYHTANSISEVRKFSEEIAKSGNWNDEPIEGFVVRCHVSDSSSAKEKDVPPYPPGSSFFFKVKYDEPYMMYRDWREITKKLLSTKGRLQDVAIPKKSLRRPESVLYLNWVRDEIKKDRSQFDGFNKGKGIIATRERFLQWLKTEHGQVAQTEQLASALSSVDLNEKAKMFEKTVIAPVAIPGCGKTTIGVALSHLFDFGHVQSDDIQAKKSAPQFIKRVKEELAIHNVVIADKNNHLRDHRRQLRDAICGMKVPVRLIALYWPLEKPPAMIHRICSDRVLERGDNHQTLRPDKHVRHHEQAVWMFIQNAEELDDGEVDEVVEMDVEEDLEQSLDRAVDACVRILGLPKPTREQIGVALAKARAYKVTQIVDRQTKRAAKVRYFGFLPEVDLAGVIETHFAENDVHPEMRELWEKMVQDKRVTRMPHATIVHMKGLPDKQKLWDRCDSLFSQPSPPMFAFRLSHLISDGRVMAATVEDLKPASNPGDDTSLEAIDFVESLDENLKNRLHVTVGTRQQTIVPVEAGSMVENWKRGKAGDNVHMLPLKDVIVQGRVKGLSG
ncbi:uncharacterized protein FOMMEDRAFT_78648 [Fomitiporia mediterranea MF3/22]|uniref:uncharacterized protein n=1 Tax=Fomitiporia mediterranea (strain MF3/22) TaxID=694068 RepID=UPI000440781B|nr:uncharacterized protein FOMMEDRAFT_78648 [Fomitiporia mediterranea MF3/22]EJD05579.1 hypothetical protein FOMMEDRAFT_78648 [Fomitiporia mediterranea MF3/22]